MNITRTAKEKRYTVDYMIRGLNSHILNMNTDDPLKGLYYKEMYSVQSVKFLGPDTHLVVHVW